jgi:hypothetical protein
MSADSASTLSRVDPARPEHVEILNVFEHQNKLFNLRKGLPVAGLTFGHGAIGKSSIATLSKDFRRLLSSDDRYWKIESDSYTIEEVAHKARRFFFDCKFVPTYAANGTIPGPLGYWVGGYSAGGELPELWDISIVNGQCLGPVPLHEGSECDIRWAGDPEAVTRLVLGHSETLVAALNHMGMPSDQVESAMSVIREAARTDLVFPQMPVQDAIDLADFLVRAAIGFARFRAGAETVGGPIEIAAVTKHEQFKWVKRKHYFSTELNPS